MLPTNRALSTLLATLFAVVGSAATGCLETTSPPADDAAPDEAVESVSNALTADWLTIGGSTPYAIAPAAFGGKLYMFTVGGDNKIYETTSTNGSSWSSSTEFGGTTDKAVSAVVFGGRLFLFAIGLSDNQIYFSKSSNGTSFTSWQSLGGSTDASVSTAVHGGKLYVMAKGGADNKLYWSSTTDGSNFTSWRAYHSTLTIQGAPAIASHDGSFHAFWVSAVTGQVYRSDLYVFATRNDDRVSTMVRGRGNNWSPYTSHWGSSILSGAAIGAASFNNSLWTFRRTNSGAIRIKSTWIHQFPFTAATGWDAGMANWDDPSWAHPAGEQTFSYDFWHLLAGNSYPNTTANRAIRAARGGEVEFVHYGSACGYGNAIAIRHDDGTVSTYAHMIAETPLVAANDVVAAGTVIGHIGATGATGGTPHTHVALCNPDWTVQMSGGCNINPCIPVPMYFADGDSAGFRPKSGDNMNLP